MAQQRNHGIDLLRMVSMFMVVVLHVLGQGGILAALLPLLRDSGAGPFPPSSESSPSPSDGLRRRRARRILPASDINAKK